MTGTAQLVSATAKAVWLPPQYNPDTWWGFWLSLTGQLAVTVLGVYWGLKWEKQNDGNSEIEDRKHKLELLHEDVLGIEKQLRVSLENFEYAPEALGKFPALDMGYLNHNKHGQREIVRAHTWTSLEKLRNKVEDISPILIEQKFLIKATSQCLELAMKAELSLNAERARLAQKSYRLNTFGLIVRYNDWKNAKFEKMWKEQEEKRKKKAGDQS